MVRSTAVVEDNPEVSKLYSAVGARIRHLREQMLLTQEELSIRSDVRRNYIVQIERLGLNLSLKLLWQLAEALNVEVGDLFVNGEGRPDRAEVKLAIVREKISELRADTQKLAAGQAEVLKVVGGRPCLAH